MPWVINRSSRTHEASFVRRRTPRDIEIDLNHRLKSNVSLIARPLKSQRFAIWYISGIARCPTWVR